MEKSLTKVQSAQSSNTLGHEVSTGGGGRGVHLTKGHHAQSSTKLGHKMSLHGVGEEGSGRVCRGGGGVGASD